MKDIGKKLMDIARWYSMPADHFNTIKEAVELLEQTELKSSYNSIKTELNDDAISRQAVLDLIADYDLSMGQVVRGIHALPSVSTEKTGRWITQWNPAHQKEYYYCSECREEYSYDGETGIKMDNYKYCPNCGAKMEVEE